MLKHAGARFPRGLANTARPSSFSPTRASRTSSLISHSYIVREAMLRGRWNLNKSAGNPDGVSATCQPPVSSSPVVGASCFFRPIQRAVANTWSPLLIHRFQNSLTLHSTCVFPAGHLVQFGLALTTSFYCFGYINTYVPQCRQKVLNHVTSVIIWRVSDSSKKSFWFRNHFLQRGQRSSPEKNYSSRRASELRQLEVVKG